MDPMMEIFFILWIFVLPILGVTLATVFPIFWFFIVPKIARTLTWKRFRKVSFHFLGDDSGYAYLLPTTEELPEGIVKTKRGFRFLPRPRWTKGNPNNPKTAMVENILLRKFVWKDMGKPIWFGYAGKVASVNPVTLAALQQTKSETLNTNGYISKIRKYVNTLSKDPKNHLTTMLNELQKGLNFQTLTVIDPTKIKEVLPQMFTPSQLDALATNRETRGMKRAGRQYTPLILGGGLILGLVIIAIILVMAFK